MKNKSSIKGLSESINNDIKDMSTVREDIEQSKDMFEVIEIQESQLEAIKVIEDMIEVQPSKDYLKKKKKNKNTILCAIAIMVVSIIVCVFLVMKDLAISSIQEDPGSAWYDAVRSISNISELEQYWPSIQTSWSQRHVNVTWETFVKFFEKNYRYGGTINVDRMLNELMAYVRPSFLFGFIAFFTILFAAAAIKLALGTRKGLQKERSRIIEKCNISLKLLGLPEELSLKESLDDEELDKECTTALAQMNEVVGGKRESTKQLIAVTKDLIDATIPYIPETYRNLQDVTIMEDLISSYQADDIKELLAGVKQRRKEMHEEEMQRNYEAEQLRLQREQNRILQQQADAEVARQKAEEKARKDVERAEKQRQRDFASAQSRYNSLNQQYQMYLNQGFMDDARRLKVSVDSAYAEMLKYQK